VIAARWAMARGGDPEAPLRAAARAAERALEVNPGNAVAYQSLAEVHRWRAEWALRSGRPVGHEVREGRRSAAEALRRNPGLAAACLTEAALLAVQAEADPARRPDLLREARARLVDAERLNPLISRDAEPIEARLAELEEQ
ncbi:MAG TPA: hypothetical protein VLT32_20640, partial [Candidatus Sulfomarinibacteraceae bacterium]|nr:hypothetical protein [Candidatus Sulfomarinibacteraceae bacterium]